MSVYPSRNIRIILISILLLSVTFLVYFYSHDVVLGDDELWYSYVMDTQRTGHYYNYIDSQTKEVTTLQDVIVSQIDHYKGVGGRSIVHAVEQYFTGVSSPSIFYVLNALIFFMTVFAIAYLGCKRNLTNLFPWLIILVILLYCLDETPRPLTSLNRAPNYLWPMLSTSLVIILFKKFNSIDDRKDQKVTKSFNASIIYIAIFLFGLLGGWTHEGYTVPVSGAIFVYYLFNYKNFRSKAAILTIGFWVGTLIILIAPGNYNRMSMTDGGAAAFLFNIKSIFHLTQVYIILLICGFLYLKNRRRFYTFIKQNSFILYSIAFSIIFTMLTYGPRVDTPLWYFTIIFLLRACQPLFKYEAKKASFYLWIICCAILLTHWTMITIQQTKDNNAARTMIANFIQSNDGVVPSKFDKCSSHIAPYLRRNFSLHPPAVSEKYSGGKKKFLVIPAADYDYLKNYPNLLFVESNRLPGETDLYTTEDCEWAWAKAEVVDSLLPERSKIHVEYAPVSFSDDVDIVRKVMRGVMPNHFPKTDIIPIYLCKTDFGNFYYFPTGNFFTPTSYSYLPAIKSD